MHRTRVSFLLFTAILLSACGQAAPIKPSSTSTVPLEVPSTPTIDNRAAKMECQVVSLSPTPGPTEASLFPGPQESDWIRGSNPEASLTITEYSDFQ